MARTPCVSVALFGLCAILAQSCLHVAFAGSPPAAPKSSPIAPPATPPTIVPVTAPAEPVAPPTAPPAAPPASAPSAPPSAPPTAPPAGTPTVPPADAPTTAPMGAPAGNPTAPPSVAPATTPTTAPTTAPTASPTIAPGAPPAVPQAPAQPSAPSSESSSVDGCAMLEIDTRIIPGNWYNWNMSQPYLVLDVRSGPAIGSIWFAYQCKQSGIGEAFQIWSFPTLGYGEAIVINATGLVGELGADIFLQFDTWGDPSQYKWLSRQAEWYVSALFAEEVSECPSWCDGTYCSCKVDGSPVCVFGRTGPKCDQLDTAVVNTMSGFGGVAFMSVPLEINAPLPYITTANYSAGQFPTLIAVPVPFNTTRTINITAPISPYVVAWTAPGLPSNAIPAGMNGNPDGPWFSGLTPFCNLDDPNAADAFTYVILELYTYRWCEPNKAEKITCGGANVSFLVEFSNMLKTYLPYNTFVDFNTNGKLPYVCGLRNSSLYAVTEFSGSYPITTTDTISNVATVTNNLQSWDVSLKSDNFYQFNDIPLTMDQNGYYSTAMMVFQTTTSLNTTLPWPGAKFGVFDGPQVINGNAVLSVGAVTVVNVTSDDVEVQLVLNITSGVLNGVPPPYTGNVTYYCGQGNVSTAVWIGSPMAAQNATQAGLLQATMVPLSANGVTTTNIPLCRQPKASFALYLIGAAISLDGAGYAFHPVFTNASGYRALEIMYGPHTPPAPSPPPAPPGSKGWVWGLVFGGLGAVLIAVVAVVFMRGRRRSYKSIN